MVDMPLTRSVPSSVLIIICVRDGAGVCIRARRCVYLRHYKEFLQNGGHVPHTFGAVLCADTHVLEAQ